MWAHPIVLLGAGAVAFIVVAAAYTHHLYKQLHDHRYEYKEPKIPQFDRRVLGPCGICRGDASVIDSYQAPCGHHLHYTCAANVRTPSNSGFPIDTRQMCMACVEERGTNNPRELTNTGLRNRRTNVQECANCLISITNGEQNTTTMECGHIVHEKCWERMQESASTTCPACMNE